MKKSFIFTFLFLFAAIASLAAQTGQNADGANSNIFNIRDYGAAGDGTTLDSPAIQKAIDTCAQAGGGTVLIPQGTYLSATIALKDNVRLYLEKDALLLGTTDYKAYDNLDPFTEGLGMNVGWAFVVAVDVKNVAIEGEGVIDGQGSALKARHIAEDSRPEGQIWGVRPFLLRVLRCDGVTVQGVTLKYAAAWTSHYAQSKNIKIENLTIISRGVAHNDGINIDGCQHVRIRNCDVDSGDDALCFKATYSKAPCRDIVVSDMRLKSNQAGIKMGTESMSAFEDITISRCHIYDTRNGGIKLFTVDGAHLRNIEISDITMDNVRTPMLFRLGSRLNVFRKNEDTQQTTGTFERVYIRNVKAKSDAQTQLNPASGILITGVPGHYINNLTLENIEIELPGGGTVEHGHRKVQEAIDRYPEVSTFGPYVPAYGVWARHVKNLQLNNVTFKLNSPDLRPAIICQDAERLIVTNLDTEAASGSETVIRLDSVRFSSITSSNIRGMSNSLLQLTGKYNSDIYLDGKQTTDIRRLVDAVNGANVATVEQRPLPDAANTAVAGARLNYAPGKTPKFWSVATAQSTMARWPDYTKAYWNSWTYVNSYMAYGFERLYRATGDTAYMGYVKRYVDAFIDENGDFRAVPNNKGVTRMPNYCTNLDGMMPGAAVVMMYEYTKDDRYRKAADKIRPCFDPYPRNNDGGFWHGAGMHGQMWIDGIFMGQMFLLRYGKSIGDSQYAWDEAALQITAYAKRGQQGNSGLYVHGVYEPGHGERECRWADPATGKSREVWGEGLGWYALVVLQALETIPTSHPKYNEIKDIFIRLAAGLKKVQDPKTGGWYQVVDKTDRPDNWLETSGSAMFTYAIQQGINLGIISKKDYGKVVDKGYKFICKHAKINRQGLVDIYSACDGLGVQENYDRYVNYRQMLNAKEAVVGFLWATEIVERNKL